MTEFTLSDLEAKVAERAVAEDGSSYTALLIKTGIEKCAQKLGEEAVETVIAATARNDEELKKEAADLLYHLLVVLKKAEIPLSDVMSELEARTNKSGLQEKAERKKK